MAVSEQMLTKVFCLAPREIQVRETLQWQTIDDSDRRPDEIEWQGAGDQRKRGGAIGEGQNLRIRQSRPLVQDVRGRFVFHAPLCTIRRETCQNVFSAPS